MAKTLQQAKSSKKMLVSGSARPRAPTWRKHMPKRQNKNFAIVSPFIMPPKVPRKRRFSGNPPFSGGLPCYFWIARPPPPCWAPTPLLRSSASDLGQERQQNAVGSATERKHPHKKGQHRKVWVYFSAKVWLWRDSIFDMSVIGTQLQNLLEDLPWRPKKKSKGCKTCFCWRRLYCTTPLRLASGRLSLPWPVPLVHNYFRCVLQPASAKSRRACGASSATGGAGWCAGRQATVNLAAATTAWRAHRPPAWWPVWLASGAHRGSRAMPGSTPTAKLPTRPGRSELGLGAKAKVAWLHSVQGVANALLWVARSPAPCEPPGWPPGQHEARAVAPWESSPLLTQRSGSPRPRLSRRLLRCVPRAIPWTRSHLPTLWLPWCCRRPLCHRAHWALSRYRGGLRNRCQTVLGQEFVQQNATWHKWPASWR